MEPVAKSVNLTIRNGAIISMIGKLSYDFTTE
jgi:hypothetical protein